MTPATDVLRRHAALFNAGVRSGDFAAMVEHFTDDAELVFEGVPSGPFRGRSAIAAAYRDHPPDDEIVLHDAREAGGAVVGDYAWRKRPDVRAGEMRLTASRDRVSRLVVTFAQRD